MWTLLQINNAIFDSFNDTDIFIFTIFFLFVFYFSVTNPNILHMVYFFLTIPIEFLTCYCILKLLEY